jgi:hypothetical protein
MRFLRALLIAGVCFALSSVAALAATVSDVSVFPSRTVPGATVMINTSTVSSSSQPVSATVTITKPGTCVSGSAMAGRIGLNLQPSILRVGNLSYTLPTNACAGTYTVTVLVKSTATGAVLASRTTSFTVQLPSAP